MLFSLIDIYMFCKFLRIFEKKSTKKSVFKVVDRYMFCKKFQKTSKFMFSRDETDFYSCLLREIIYQF